MTATSRASATSKATGTSKSTTTTFDTDTSIFERSTATGNTGSIIQTEVSSGSAHNARYWDGDSWEED